jgi:tRNA nucleotidyltransferase (CCA-adding enzyme)
MPDYMFLLESRLSPEQHAALVRVQELAQAQTSNVYLTGGAVRDLISGMPIRDLDFTVEGNPIRIVRELEKGGAQILSEDERLRQVELIFTGDVDGSISASRDEVYPLPGTRPEMRWATVMEDLRRRDFSINAIAISLNAASRGLLLDPTNGLADLEKHEVRSLSIHGFTNQPGRLLRIVRFCARLGFKMESRTRDWFELAVERGLHESIPPEAVGREVRQLGREEHPTAILRAWESRGLIGAIHPHLQQRHPDYEALARLGRVTESMVAAGVRPRLFAPVTHNLLGRLKSRERSAALHRLQLRAAELQAVLGLEQEAEKVVKMLKGRKTASPHDAFVYLEKVPRELLAFIQAECAQQKVLGKIRNFLHKWRPLRLSLPAGELDALGVPRGPKFDKILEDLFELQLRGRGRMPPDRTRLLRQLAGIKPEPKKQEKEKEKESKEKKDRKKELRGKGAPPAGKPSAHFSAVASGQPAAGPAEASKGALQPAATKGVKGAPAAASKPAGGKELAGQAAKKSPKPAKGVARRAAARRKKSQGIKRRRHR